MLVALPVFNIREVSADWLAGSGEGIFNRVAGSMPKLVTKKTYFLNPGVRGLFNLGKEQPK